MLKAAPYLVVVGLQPRGDFGWRREGLVMDMGSNWATWCPVFIQSEGTPLVWSTTDPGGHEVLNLDLFERDGALRENDWTLHPAASDLECPPEPEYAQRFVFKISAPDIPRMNDRRANT